MAEPPLMKRIVQEALPFMLVTTLAGVTVGLILSGMTELIEMLPGLIVLVPAVLDMRGCISTALGSRLSTGIHLGVIGWHLGVNEDLRQNIAAALILSLSLSLVVGLLAHFTSLALGLPSAGLIALTSISVIAGALAGVSQIGLTTVVALYSAKRGLDPDNVTIPAVATMADVLGILCLFLAAIIVGRLGLIGYL